MIKLFILIFILLTIQLCMAQNSNSTTPITQPSSTELAKRWQITIEPTYGLDTTKTKFYSDDDGPGPNEPVEIDLTSRNAFQTIPISFQYSISPQQSLYLNIPYIFRSEELKGIGLTLNESRSGLGDIRLGYENQFNLSSESTWRGSLGIDLQTPTGSSQFNSNDVGLIPLGTGHYEITGTFGMQKVADPLIITYSTGVNYTCPRTLTGYRIKPELGYSIQTGLGFAINDRMILTEQLQYSRSSNVFLISNQTTETKVDQAYITHSLIYNRGKNKSSYRFSLTTGLNDASTDIILNVALLNEF